MDINNKQTNWHAIDTKELFAVLKSSPDGLNDYEYKKRVAQYGKNTIEQSKPISALDLLIRQFKSPLIYLLIIVCLITLILQKYVDTIVITIIIVINSTVGWIQELKAEKSLEAIKKLIALKCIVLRNDQQIEIDSSDLVPGDIIILSSGQKVPADIRLLETDELKLDESSLTGESVAIRKDSINLSEKTVLADRKNMIYASTIITSGKGKGVVVATANNTEIGKIAKKVITTEDKNSTINTRIVKLGKIILYAVAIICFFVFMLGIWRQQELVNMFFTTVAVAVGAIPEGLPALITVVLAIGVHRMVKRNALVRKMQSIETLGNINVIASDKTGTLTLNQMFLEKIYLTDQKITIDGNGYDPKGNFYIHNDKINSYKNTPLNSFLLTGTLCNDSSLTQKESKWQIQGDPTEGALIVAAEKAQISKKNTIKSYPRIDEIQFNSEIGYMATLNKHKDKNYIHLKGKIEIILNACSYFLDKNNKIQKLTPKIKKEIENASLIEAENAYRIIGLGYKKSISSHQITKKDINDFIYLGFACLKDPPKQDAINAISKCKMSGIRPIMITGDHPQTALAIAKIMGIAKNNDPIITGEKLEQLSKHKLAKITKSVSVFARITPEAKYKIVESLQEQGNIVGVTGDGINDAPVLKKADTGIAMGIGGTDVAREASDIVLLDNNFSTIIAAIEEGRTIFLNIRRIIFFLISTNIGEVLIIITSLLLNLPLALTATQILWINLVTDTTGGMALVMEPKHRTIDQIKSERFKTGFVDKISLIRIFIVAITMTIGTIYIYQYNIANGMSLEKARSITFVIMAIFQIFNVFNARSMTTSIFKTSLFSNKYIIPLFIVSMFLTYATTQIDLLRNLLGTKPLSLEEWIMAISICSTVFMVSEIDKALRKK
jgi:Ca2+-transporting ATPase